MQPESPWLRGRERAKQQPQRNGKPRSARWTVAETWHHVFPLFTQNAVHVFYVCSAFLQPFIRGFIKISTPQQLPGNTHLLRLITCDAHLLSADRTVPRRAAYKTGFGVCFFLPFSSQRSLQLWTSASSPNRKDPVPSLSSNGTTMQPPGAARASGTAAAAGTPTASRRTSSV